MAERTNTRVLRELNFGKLVREAEGPEGLVPAVLTNIRNGVFLDAGLSNKDLLMRRLSPEWNFWSLGSEGPYARVVEIRPDCDFDTLLILMDLDPMSEKMVLWERSQVAPIVRNYSDLNGLNFKSLKVTNCEVGIVAATIVDWQTQQPLMVGFMNEEALRLTFELRRCVFWERSEKKLWEKGESSGNSLELKGAQILNPYKADVIAVYAQPTGPVCHNGTTSCFENTRKMF